MNNKDRILRGILFVDVSKEVILVFFFGDGGNLIASMQSNRFHLFEKNKFTDLIQPSNVALY